MPDPQTRRQLLAALIAAAPLIAGRAASPPYRIEVRKSERQLALFHNSELTYRFRISLGFAPEGSKLRQGDGRTPEGNYRTILKNPRSSFYRSVMINYPLPADARRGFRDGLITAGQRDAILRAHREGGIPPQNTRLGGDIFLHGGGNQGDWTLGCVALANGDMDVLFALPVGVAVHILP